MRILNTDYILYGTAEKALITDYTNLMSNFTESAAEDYQSRYKDQPLSFILNNSRYIYSEPKFGYGFYKNIMESCDVDPILINNEKIKVAEYLNLYESQMSDSQKSDYNALLTLLTEKAEETKTKCILETILENRNPEESENAVRYYDALYAYESSEEKDIYPVTVTMESLSPLGTLIHATGKLTGNVDVERVYNQNIKNSYTFESTDNLYDYKSTIDTILFTDVLCKTSNFTESVKTIRNLNTVAMLESFQGVDLTDYIMESFKDVGDGDGIIFTTPQDTVYSLFNESSMEELMTSEMEERVYRLLQDKHTMYESCQEYVMASYEVSEDGDAFIEPTFFTDIKESMGATQDVTCEEALDLIMEATAEIEAEMALYEYEATGAPNNVIKKTHLGFREDPKLKTTTNSVAPEVSDDDIPDDAPANASSNNIQDPKDPKKTPLKPKTGLVQGIQNKAMDAHAKSRQKAAGLRKVGTGLKNAGKAILKIPSGIVNGFKGMIASWDRLDDERRKQYMLKPGFRKKWFRNIRVAATYGAAAYTSALLVPVVWFANRMSKEKNKRIRNEFSSELDTEIKVCEAKIEDANAAGDQQQKYRLMRIRDKFAVEKDRVASNGKYL